MMQQANATPSQPVPDAIIQLVRAIARRQARIDARRDIDVADAAVMAIGENVRNI